MTRTDTPAPDPHPLTFLAGGGQMGTLIRSMDWSTTSLGPVAGWPQSLRTTVSICLASDLPICVIWGSGLVQIYNDAYRVICGNKHPRSMGQNFAECWQEAWPVIGRAHDSALAGDTAFLEAQHIFLERHGYLEECFFTFSFSPIRDESGRVGGLFHPVIEMTTQMLSERRTRALRDLAAQTSKARSVSEALILSAQVLAENDLDLPFVQIYELDADGGPARRVGATSPTSNAVANPATSGSPTEDPVVWPLEEVARSCATQQVGDLRHRLGADCFGPYREAPNTALVLPIMRPGADRAVAVLVTGISARLPMNEAYRTFYDLLAAGVTTAVVNSSAYDDERRRAKALAELDRAKTAFFSNVSHEFRTPLTLMLGPVEDALAASDEALPASQRERLQVVQRNGMRLQRLVNSLLDFSRIEAGRVRAAFEPTDLAAFTADLASNFRSACEKAGLNLRVDCPPLTEPVYVDRPMWEKIVLNLLSNAFKFTFEGEIAVTLRQLGRATELLVRDTGTGIPAAELPRLFERFHRVENARGRTHEGSGIGLALVQELVKLHGGTISAESVAAGEAANGAEPGSTLRILIPLGIEHLPHEQVGTGSTAAQPAMGASPFVNPFVQEALRWLPDAEQPPEPGSAWLSLQDDPLGLAVSTQAPSADRPRVLVADDNVDMRRYIERLLSGTYQVEALADGEAALARVRWQAPDLILSDVMMPRLDGFGLLRALRGDPHTAGVPIILLSARADEESRDEGMQAGADDYLVKPFSARELLARVAALLQITRMRREADQSIRASEQRFRAFVSATSDVVYRMSADWTEMHHLQGREFIADTHEPSRSWLEKYIALDDQPQVTAAIAASIRSKSVFELEHRVVRVDGTLGWTFSRAIPLFDGQGQIMEWFGVASDVTARKFAEHEREQLVNQLREQDGRKNEFLATLAHELRNPLAPIRNGLQLMKLARDDGEAMEKSRAMMERQVGHMVRLIDDLLDLSRINQGSLELKKERMELSAVVRHAVETSHPLIQQMGHDLKLALPPEPIFIDGDMIRLTQVISNLLNNAAKYTDRGGRILLSAERQGVDAVVTVEDNGMGIPAHMLRKVFDMFTQVDRSLERSKGGLGIGLSLVQRLVDMHGGSVEARSDGDGKGSTFVVRLPVVQSVAGDRPEHVEAEPAQPQARRRILVVDDNVDAATSLAMLLDIMGNDTQTAHDGLEALEVAAAFRPDVALLDIGMPKLNGYEVCRRIRQQPWGKGMVLFALTGWGQEEDQRRSLAAGFDAHLVKPVLPAALEKLLDGVTAAKD